MKKLSPKDTKIAEFTLLSAQFVSRQLFRTNEDQYVIALLDRDTAIFAFESSIFTEVLNDLGGGIEDVTVVTFQEAERMEDGEAPGFEVRLYLKGGEIASVNSKDQVHLMLPAAYESMDDETEVKPVCEVWDLADVYPFSHLQISENLIHLMSRVVDDTSAEDALWDLWSSYQKITNDRSIKPPISYFTVVSGNHCEFRVTEHPCGKVTLSL